MEPEQRIPSTNEPRQEDQDAAHLQHIEDGTDELQKSTETTPSVAQNPIISSRASHRWRGVALTVAGLVIGALGGIFVYSTYLQKTTTSTDTAQTNTSTTPASSGAKSMNAEALVTAMKAKMKSPEVPTTSENALGMVMTKGDNFGAWSVTYAKPAGYRFYTLPQTMLGFTVASNDSDATFADLSSVRAYLDDQGFESSVAFFDDANGIQGSSEFSTAAVRCTVAETSYQYKQGKYQVQVGCADMSSYAAEAKTTLPLYDVYIAANQNQKGPGMLFMRPSISDSPVAGYKRAHVSVGNIYSPVGGGRAALYQTPDSTWHYFGTTQDEALCSEYKTTETKKAFSGEACALDNGGQSTVKP